MATLPTIVMPDQFNAASAFLDRNLAEGRGAKSAIFYEGKAYTYAQVAELANRVGNGLLELGIDLEQRVAMLLLDSPQFAATFFGAIKIGAVAVPLNTLLRPKDYAYMLNDSRARVLLIHAALWEQIAPVLAELTYLRHIIVVGTVPESSALSGTKAAVHSFEEWVNRASSSLEAVE